MLTQDLSSRAHHLLANGESRFGKPDRIAIIKTYGTLYGGFPRRVASHHIRIRRKERIKIEDIIGFLTVNQWLAVLRIGIGLWWLKSFAHKPLRNFVSGQMVGWTVSLADNHPVPAFGRAIKGLVAPNAAWFPYLVLAGELAVGIGMVFGFLTPISLLVAILLNLNYIALAGVKPKDISVNRAYQCEQGQNWSMLIAEVVLFFTVAVSGCTWSIDRALGLFCAA